MDTTYTAYDQLTALVICVGFICLCAFMNDIVKIVARVFRKPTELYNTYLKDTITSICDVLRYIYIAVLVILTILSIIFVLRLNIWVGVYWSLIMLHLWDEYLWKRHRIYWAKHDALYNKQSKEL